ncbi:MAG: indolepyruvate ferredoxin oxidoreductase subunit beta [Archaeoglobaceae archaeon]
MKFNVLIVGVGGQGALTTAAVIARAAMKSGHNVVASETHGMAQRGGSVEVHVRIGDVLSPLIPLGDADVVLALEPVEALRYVHYVSEKSKVILNTRKILPPSVTTGQAKYPDLEEIIDDLRSLCEVYPVEAWKIAERAGNLLATNVAIIGIALALTKLPFGIDDAEWAVKEIMSGRLLDVNLRALKMGYEEARSVLLSAV